MTAETCIFCQMLAGRAPMSVIYEDDLTVAFLDINQPQPYKTLVIPRAHAPMVYDLTDDQAAAIMKTTVKVAKAIQAVTGCEGMNLVQANGEVGFQEVFHFHMHLVPRHRGDDVRIAWGRHYPDRPTLDDYANTLKQKLQA